MTPDIKYLNTERVYGNPDQPRKHFPLEHINDLAASIAEKGQQQAGIVVEDAQGRYMIVAGECRWRACKIVGVPFMAEVKSLTPDQIADIAIIENYQRRDMSPIEEAQAFQARIDAGVSIEDLAQRLGIRRTSTIRNRLALLNLNKCYQVALQEGVLTIGQAHQMVRLSGSGQDALWKLLSAGKLKSYQSVMNATDQLLMVEQQTCLFDLPMPSEKELSVVSRMERQIEKIELMVSSGFKDNEVVILKKINPQKAEEIAQKLGLISKSMLYMRDALEQAIQRAQVQGVLV